MESSLHMGPGSLMEPVIIGVSVPEGTQQQQPPPNPLPPSWPPRHRYLGGEAKLCSSCLPSLLLVLLLSFPTSRTSLQLPRLLLVLLASSCPTHTGSDLDHPGLAWSCLQLLLRLALHLSS